MILVQSQINKNLICRWQLRSQGILIINQFNTARKPQWRAIEVRNNKMIWPECKTWTISSWILFNLWIWCQFKLIWIPILDRRHKCQKVISTLLRIQIAKRHCKIIGTVLRLSNKLNKQIRVQITRRNDQEQLVALQAKSLVWVSTILWIRVCIQQEKDSEWTMMIRIGIINDRFPRCKKLTSWEHR